MAVKPKGFLARLKAQIAAAGQSKKGFWFVKEGQKRRVRFLRGSDLEEGITIPWHSKWEGQKNVVDCPCLATWGKECPFCDNPDIRLRERFAWTVYDYEARERQIFLFYANRNSPIPHLTSNYEEFGTLVDRDYTIQRTGNQTDTIYTIMGAAPSKFRDEAKPFPESKLLALIWKAFGQGDLDDYPDEGDTEDEDDEEYDDDAEEEEDTDDEEEEYDEDEEEEEEIPPRRKKSVKAAPKVVAKKPAARQPVSSKRRR